jgi:hypothetical protein
VEYTSCEWFLNFLVAQWANLPPQLSTLPRGLQDAPSGLETPVMFELLEAVASLLSARPRVSIRNIKEHLVKANILSGDLDAVGIESAYKLVFIVIGWLTQIYHPDTRSEISICAIMPLLDSLGCSMSTETFKTNSKKLSEVSQIPIFQLLQHFGCLLPIPIVPVGRSTALDLFSDQLVVSYLNFQTLSEIAGIKIEFVSCISLHLELDEESGSLLFFQFPSSCMVMGSRALFNGTHSGNDNEPYLSQYVH